MDKAVVKVGGSLALRPNELKALCRKLNEASKKHKLVIVPGGGEFADTVRNLDERFNLSPQAAHKMAILGMDQYGLLLSDLLECSRNVEKFDAVQKAWDSGELPIFLPSRHFLRVDPLENSWNVTSDSIASYIAGQLGINTIVLVTDVDGVYTDDPKKTSDAKLISHLSALNLLQRNKRTSVDMFLPKLLLQLHLECFVVNGLFPERVEAILNGEETVCTQIKWTPPEETRL